MKNTTNGDTARTIAPKVLLVDDDSLILATLAAGLRERGFQPITASEPETALSLLESHKPDIAVLDYNLPRLSGLEVARAIANTSGIPFIFLSAFGDEAIYRDALNLGAVGYLVKPMDPDQMVPSIWAGLQSASNLRRLRQDSEGLNLALQASRDVSVVTGLLMERLTVSQAQAYEALRMYARSHQRSLQEVGREILQSAELLGGTLAEIKGLISKRRE